MHKILILTNRSRPDRMLVALLKTLFSDSEINVIGRASGPDDHVPASREKASLVERGGT